jgi:glycosyltransferase involved in cell wall biosynthesis
LKLTAVVAHGTAIEFDSAVRRLVPRPGRSHAPALRILFVAPYVPSRLRPRPLHIIRALAERGHRVTLIAALASAREGADLDALATHCESAHGVRLSRPRSLWSCARGLADPVPRQARFCLSPRLAGTIRQALETREEFDLLHIEHLRAALYVDEAPGLPCVYDAVDCMSRLLEQTAVAGPTWSSRMTARLELQRTRQFERSALRRFGRILLSAESERAAWLGLDEASPEHAARVHVLPNGVELSHFTAGAERDSSTLIFVGRMGYHANHAAALQLIREVMPRVWERRPDARLLIVGADPRRALRALARRAGPRVEVTGAVADVRPYLRRATVSVNPLIYGVGVQNKVLEAMACGTPVVATPAACGGVLAKPGAQLLVAEDADGCAHHVLRLLDDPTLARHIGSAGRAYVEAQHDWRAVARSLEEIYLELRAEHVAGETRRAGAA